MGREAVHLHSHSYYSLLDGLDSPSELVNAAKELGQTAMALTDHGTLSGHREFQRACYDAGIKPILGNEAYFSPTDRFDKRDVKKRDDNTQIYNHLILLGKNQNGLDNIHAMSRIAWTEGYYYKPRIDWDLLNEYGDDVIVLTGCLNGIPAKAIEAGKPEVAEEFLRKLKERFGDDVYIEVQPHNPPEINAALLDLADKFGISPTVTADCHYAKEEDRALEDIFLILSAGKSYDAGHSYTDSKHITDVLERLNFLYPDRFMTFQDIDVFVASRVHLEEGMAKQGFKRDDMLDSTLEIADKVGDYEYPENLDLLPCDFDDPTAVLEAKALDGLKKRGVNTKEYIDRVTEELRIIRKKNFAPYFLIIEDVVNWAKSNDILVGPGRGSGAGSLILYALGVTEVDPLKYDLLFARFINEERNDFPDVDIDFEDTRRGEVKDYVRKKYKHVANIATFGHFEDKGVLRDVARAFKVPIGETNKAMKHVASFESYEESTHPAVAEYRQKYPEVLEYASRLRGKIRQAGMHAGGVVISKEPIEKIAPIETRDDPDQKGKKRVPLVAYNMNVVEDLGLIKFDFLGLKSLGVIHDALDLIEERHGERVDLYSLDLDGDKRVYEELSAGHTVGVFQCEAGPYTRLLRELGVDNFDELVNSNALVRPGAADTVGKDYVLRKRGEQKVTYPHELTEPYLKRSLGVHIFQESVMLTAVKIGGFSWSDADRLRKIIGKKKDKSEFDKYKQQWMDGAEKNITKAMAEKLWTDFEAHAGYSFNASHAVAYSMLSYYTAWLRINYPIEYMTALMRNEGDKEKLTTYFIECKRLDIPLKLPHVNGSDLNFTIQIDSKKGDYIRVGLTNIKWVGEGAAKRIMKLAPIRSFKELEDAASEKYSGISSRVIESLNAVGAASFPDNLKSGKEQDNYYEYLKIPKFKHIELPTAAEDMITPLDDYSEDGVYILRALVTGIKKRGETWSLLDIIDETGTSSVFHTPDTALEPGQLYFMIVGNKRVLKYLTAQELEDSIHYGSNEPMVRLLGGDASFDDGPDFMVHFHKRKTKSGRMMGHLIVCNEYYDLREVLVFPKSFGQFYKTIKGGKSYDLITKYTQDNSEFLIGVRDA